MFSTSWYLANFKTDTTKTADFKMYIYVWDGANTVGSAVYASSSAVSLTKSNVGGVMDSQSLTFTHITTLSASSIYIMVLVFNSGDEAFTLGEIFLVAHGAFFSSGTEFNVSGPSDGAFSGSWTTPDYDLGVSITVRPAPVPEPKTAAAGLAALFLAGLIADNSGSAARPIRLCHKLSADFDSAFPFFTTRSSERFFCDIGAWHRDQIAPRAVSLRCKRAKETRELTPNNRYLILLFTGNETYMVLIRVRGRCLSSGY